MKPKDSYSRRTNEKITAPSVRLVDEDGSVLGLMSKDEALEIARQKQRDLVEMSLVDNVSTCRLLDYSRFVYDSKRKQKKKKVPGLKEIRLSLKIGISDYNTKINQAIKMLSDGHKVRFFIRFSGRENMHPEIGFDLMNKVLQSTVEIAKVDSEAKKEGTKMFMTLVPIKS